MSMSNSPLKQGAAQTNAESFGIGSMGEGRPVRLGKIIIPRFWTRQVSIEGPRVLYVVHGDDFALLDMTKILTS